MIQTLDHFLPIAISALALVVTAAFSYSTQLDRKLSSRLQRERDLHQWACEVALIYVDILAGNESERSRALALLSIMIDYGRLLFPNETTPRAKSEYDKGRRSSVLDPLVETFDRCKKLGKLDNSKLQQDWREFTNQLGSRTTAFAINTSPEADGFAQYRNP